MGESRKEALKLGFDGSARLEFRGATVSSDTGLLAYRDVDDVFALTATASAALKDCRTGTNIRHSLTALLWQSIYSRLAGYDDLNDADRLAVDPVDAATGGRSGYGQGSRVHQSDGPLRDRGFDAGGQPRGAEGAWIQMNHAAAACRGRIVISRQALPRPQVAESAGRLTKTGFAMESAAFSGAGRTEEVDCPARVARTCETPRSAR